MATENSGLWLATALAAPLGYAVLALFVVVLPLATALRCVRRRCCNPRRFDWSGAHVLITGGSSGIGLAVAQEVAKRGASVTLVARTRTTLKAALAAVSCALRGKEARGGHTRSAWALLSLPHICIWNTCTCCSNALTARLLHCNSTPAPSS